MAVVALLILISLIIIVTLEQLEVSKLYGISDMMTHINLLVISLWGLPCALFAIGLSCIVSLL